MGNKEKIQIRREKEKARRLCGELGAVPGSPELFIRRCASPGRRLGKAQVGIYWNH